MQPDSTEPRHGEPSGSATDVELQPASAPGFAALVRLCGEHDIATSRELGELLAPIYGNVLVDLTGCEFIDSSTIGVLLAASTALEREGHHLELIVPPENSAVGRTLRVSGATQLLKMRATDADRPPQDKAP